MNFNWVKNSPLGASRPEFVIMSCCMIYYVFGIPLIYLPKKKKETHHDSVVLSFFSKSPESELNYMKKAEHAPYLYRA